MNDPAKKQAFDFSEWSSLASTDPKAFEKRRELAIETAIQAMPDDKQQRMRRLQWRIDQERRLSKTPMAACIRLSNMMWENVLGENGLLDHLSHAELVAHGQTRSLDNSNVLSFPGRNQ